MEITRGIPWARLLAEGTAIVLSILLAFAIDAWWEERRELAVKHAQLRGLVEEFKEGRSQLELQVRGLEKSLLGTMRFIELTGPNASNESLKGAQNAPFSSEQVAPIQ